MSLMAQLVAQTLMELMPTLYTDEQYAGQVAVVGVVAALPQLAGLFQCKIVFQPHNLPIL